MNKVLRSLLLGMLAFLSCQVWGYASTTALTYTYDASGHVHIDRSTETECQKLKYDGESNPLKSVDTRRENPVGENSRIGAFFVLVDGLFVTKGRTTSLFRAVKSDELADIANSQAFRNPAGIETKFFSETAEGAASFAKQSNRAFRDGPFTIVETAIPRGAITPGMKVTVDRGIPTVGKSRGQSA